MSSGAYDFASNVDLLFIGFAIVLAATCIAMAFKVVRDSSRAIIRAFYWLRREPRSPGSALTVRAQRRIRRHAIAMPIWCIIWLLEAKFCIHFIRPIMKDYYANVAKCTELVQQEQVQRDQLRQKEQEAERLRRFEIRWQRDEGYIVYHKDGRHVIYVDNRGWLQEVSLKLPESQVKVVIESNDPNDYRHPQQDFQRIKGDDLQAPTIASYHFKQ